MSDKTQSAINRAHRAKAILDDELFNESFEALETEFIELWRGAKLAEERERIWQAINILGRVRDHLGMVIGNGKIAQVELERLKSLK
jgi:hypothetical protein